MTIKIIGDNMNTERSKNYNWMVNEARLAFAKLNKIKRAEVSTMEEKTLVTIELSKMDYNEIRNELKKYN